MHTPMWCMLKPCDRTEADVKTDRVTVFDLFEKQRRYLVPIFQRGYVWTRGGQWEPLWQDVAEQAEVVRQNRGKSGAVRKHFLGAIVLNQAVTQVKQVAASEIIDGQQRLMTLQILLAALRDLAADVLGPYPKTIIQNLTSNVGVGDASDERFKVWPTHAFQEDFRRVMTAGSAASLSQMYPQHSYYRKLIPPHPPVVDAYLFFSEQIKKFLMDEGHEEGQATTPLPERAEELFETATRWIQLVAIELEAEDDPQVIFESLNARGVPLEPSDLIRNYLFLFGLRKGENVPQLYDRWWKDFDETLADGGKARFWKVQQRQGRLNRSRLDLFLYHYVTCRAQCEVSVGHLYHEFRKWFEEEERSCQLELERIKGVSLIFRDLVEPNESTQFGVFAARIRALDVAPVYPLVLFLSERKDTLTPEEFSGVQTDIESYLVRRFVCGLTSKNYNRVLVSVLSRLATKTPCNRAAVQAELLSLAGDSSVWPDDEEFLSALVFGPLYARVGPTRIQMILRALEGELTTSMHEKLTIHSFLTVEHVMPQSATPGVYPYPAPILDAREVLSERVSAIHRLGNLTLLTQPLNSSVSNGPFSDKRRALAMQSHLALNSYFQRLHDDDPWSEAQIEERGAELAALAMQIWPKPQSVIA